MQVALRDAMLCLDCYAAGPQESPNFPDRRDAWNTRTDLIPDPIDPHAISALKKPRALMAVILIYTLWFWLVPFDVFAEWLSSVMFGGVE